jgi:hypothetical protein
MSLWNSFPGKGNKEEAGLNKGMVRRRITVQRALTYYTISVPINRFCTVALQVFLHFQQTIA